MPEFDLPLSSVFLVVVCSYLVGSIPFGMIMSKVMGLGNLREIGSGNIGATNVLRTGNKTAAFLTLVFDAAKGALAVLIAKAVFGNTGAQIAGLCAFLGHLFPVWLGFKGGKGVATFLGLVLALNFWAGFAACVTWLATALGFRISSLAALVSTAAAPLWLGFLGLPSAIGLGITLAALIWWRHKDNIARIMAGTEPRIGKGKI